MRRLVRWLLVGALAGLALGCGRDATSPAPRQGSGATRTVVPEPPATPPTGSATASSPPPGAPAGEEAEPFGEMPVADVAGKIARREPLVVVDVNAREQYERGHVPGAIWMSPQNVVATALPVDRSTPLVFYCWNEH